VCVSLNVCVCLSQCVCVCVSLYVYVYQSETLTRRHAQSISQYISALCVCVFSSLEVLSPRVLYMLNGLASGAGSSLA